MSLLGSWNVNIAKGMLPQKVATGLGEALETLIGATYEPLIYVGEQIVNGVNHMIIAKQTRATAAADVAIVKMIINEKAIDEIKSRFSVVSVEPLYESDGLMGGWQVSCEDVSEEIKGKVAGLTEGLVGASYKTLLVAASQVVNGANYKILAKQTLILASPVEHLVEMTINVDSDGKAAILGIKTLV